MREDPADRGVSGKYHLVGWSNTSGCVSIAADSQPTVAQVCTSACRLGSQDQANACTQHDVAVACRCVVEHWGSCWLAGWLHLWCYRQVIAGRKGCSMVSIGLAIIQDEPDSAELFGCGSTSHVCGFGLCRVGNAVFAGIDSWKIRTTGCSGGHAGETSSMCYRTQGGT